MERTQKSRFLGLLCSHCVISWQTTHIYIQLQDIYKRSKSECTLCSASAEWDVTLNLDDTEQDTYETRKSKTELPTKRENPKGNQGGRLRRRREGAGLLHWSWAGEGFRLRAFKWRLSVSPWHVEGKPKSNRKTPSDNFQYRLQSTSLSLFFGKMDDREEIKKV